MTRRIAVLPSGTGSLLAAMLEKKLPIVLVVADRECRALQIARDAGIPNVLLLPRIFGPNFDRVQYTKNMLALFRHHKIELVAMAGFMTTFSALMFERDAYLYKILNSHPSLLPAFKGRRAVRDAIEYGVKISGCTIHWATKELDTGPILLQEIVQVLSGDTIESLHERIKKVEREVYPKLLHRLISPND